MSRTHYTETEAAPIRCADALERIADTLDDYMEMSLAAQDITRRMQSLDPGLAEVMAPLTEVLERIRARREAR